MKSELRFALLGCGKVAKKHAEAIQAADHARLVTVVDMNQNIAADFASEYGVFWHTDIHDMMSKEDIDVVSIATPTGTHHDLCMDIIPYKKDIIVEKPVTLRLDDVNHLMSESQKAGICLFEVKQYRFHPAVQALHDALASGRFEKLVFVDAKTFWCRPKSYYEEAAWRGTWDQDGGVFMNQAIHHIDLLQWLAGPVDSVYAKGDTVLSGIEAEDVGCAILTFTSGIMGVVEATTCARPMDIESSISILGEKGSVVIGGNATNQIKSWKFQDKQAIDDQIIEQYSKPSMSQDKTGHRRMYQEVVNCLSNGRDTDKNSYLVDIKKAQTCIELMHAIYESMETGQEISIHSGPRKNKLGRAVSSLS